MANYQSFDGHGVDVAVNRADSLDKLVLTYISEHPGCRVLDLGSGAGGQSVRMVEAGAIVTAVDQFDFTQQFASYGFDAKQLQFMCGDITDIETLLPNQQFDMAICQRTIHYLRYSQALTFLKQLTNIVTDKLFISVTGSGSLVADSYAAADTPLPDRFASLSERGQEMFSIHEPVCLYSEAEFIELLIDAGWTPELSKVTAFGNIQAICKRTTS